MSRRFEIVARSTRSGFAESWHWGAAAVVAAARETGAAGGALVARIGDPRVEVLLRSAAKPLQVVPLLLAGGERELGLEDADLALISASHAGTAAHVERVERLLERGGFSPRDLACGPHPPYDPAAAAALSAAGERPGALHNNCSGKHAGMLLACRLLDLPTEGYIAVEHPLQRRILDETARFSGRERADLRHGVDGCSLPTCLLSLSELARVFSRFADPAASGLDTERSAAAARMARALAAAPEMVAGAGRFTTRLIRQTGGRVLGKEGADGLYAVAVRGPVALGVAVKIADGTEDCRPGVVLDVLRQLGVLSADEFAGLEDLYAPRRLNWRGVDVGAVEPDVELREVGPR